MTGFFEESKGTWSMTRLTIFLITLCIMALVGSVCYYLIKGKPDAAVIAAVGGIMLTLVAKGAVAILNRNSGEEEKPKEG